MDSKLNCAKANQMDLVDYLLKLGYQPQKTSGKQYWYLSPLREEKQLHLKSTEAKIFGMIMDLVKEERL